MSATELNDEAGNNWILIQQYSPDLAKDIEKRCQSDGGGTIKNIEKQTKKNILAFIRFAGYGGENIGHGSGGHGDGMQGKTKSALKVIADRLPDFKPK